MAKGEAAAVPLRRWRAAASAAMYRSGDRRSARFQFRDRPASESFKARRLLIDPVCSLKEIGVSLDWASLCSARPCARRSPSRRPRDMAPRPGPCERAIQPQGAPWTLPSEATSAPTMRLLQSAWCLRICNSSDYTLSRELAAIRQGTPHCFSRPAAAVTRAHCSMSDLIRAVN